MHDSLKAKNALEKAFHMDSTDARVFFELDSLYKTLNYSPQNRLMNMNAHTELLTKRDDLHTEYITLLNLNGEYENAYHRILNHNFHPWEGGEGKIPAQYRIALIHMAQNADKTTAIKYLEAALTYPLIETVPNFFDNTPASPLFEIQEGNADLLFCGFDLERN